MSELELEDELKPDFSEFDQRFWYIAGVSAGFLVAGIGVHAGLFVGKALAIVGGIGFIVTLAYSQIHDV